MMTDEQIKAYHDAMEKEFDEWVTDDDTHWISAEDAAWQAWTEQEERKAHLKMAAEAEAKFADQLKRKLDGLNEKDVKIKAINEALDYATDLVDSSDSAEALVDAIHEYMADMEQ